jgi:hypothetical protein
VSDYSFGSDGAEDCVLAGADYGSSLNFKSQ